MQKKWPRMATKGLQDLNKKKNLKIMLKNLISINKLLFVFINNILLSSGSVIIPCSLKF